MISLAARIDQICESIDRLISTEFDARPEGSRGKMILLYDAARKQSPKPLVQAAAEALIAAARGSGPVLVSSGWVIDFWYPRGEICGMIGAGALARAISRGLRTKVCFLCEDAVLPVFDAICGAAGMRVYPPDALQKLSQVVAAQSFPVDAEAARAATVELLEVLRPSAIITIEKCSPNTKGVYHTGRGTDMSGTTAKVGILIEEARRRGILTIGIGDLGNEVGFGNIREAVEQHIPFGADCGCGCGGGIASDVKTDHLIVASSSNRGGYGLEAAMATILGNPSVMHDGDMDQQMIRAACQAGAVDSFTVGPTATDGHGTDMHYSACLVELLRQLVLSRDVEFDMYEARA
ncbi:MAG TPA: glutamate cyclase domain-containing protein [Nitrospirales bacterium]|jgi:hypothetical protein